MKYNNIILIILLNIGLFGNPNKSLFESNIIAETYFESGMYEDAINVYKNILITKENLFGLYNKELISTLYSLSDIYLLLSDIETSEEYLKRALKIHYNDFLKEQTAYISTFNKIKNIYQTIEDSVKINEIDSLIDVLKIIESDTIVYEIDSLNYFPKIIHFQKSIVDSSSLVSKYSNNDKAIDLFNDALNYLNTGLYTESIYSFNNALQINAELIDQEYLLNLNYGDSIITNKFSTTLSEIASYDSTIIVDDLLLALINIQIEGDVEYTASLIEKYIQKRPSDIRPYQIMGDIYLSNENYIDALSYFHRANLVNPKILHNHLYAGISMFYLGYYFDAINMLEYALTLDEYNGLAKFYIGLSYFELEEHTNSIHYLTEALLLNYINDEIYYYLGMSYKFKNQNMQALESFKQSVLINPTNGLSHFQLGDIYESIFKDDLALEEYQFADKYLDSDSLNLKYGTLLYKNNFHKKAMSPLRDYIINNPYSDTVLTYLGEIFIIENRFPEAIDTYNRLIDLNPYYSDYYKKIAESYYKLGNYKASKEAYLEYLSFDTENADILITIGDISNKLYDFEAAELFLLEAIACTDINEKLLFELGIAYGGQKKYLQAAQSFKDAINLSKEENPILYFQLGVVYQELSLHDLAIMQFSKFLEKNKNDAMANMMIGSCYQKISKFEDAIFYYEKALKNKNSNALNILYQIGLCYKGLEQNNNSAKYFKRTLKINPDFALSRYQLITLYFLLNKKKEAKKECDILYMLDRDLYNSSNYCTSL